MHLELRVGSNSNEVFVISCYAPTFGAGREEKDSFYGLLQGVSPKYHPRSAMCCWGTSMFVWAQRMRVMNGRMRGVHTGLESSMKLTDNCFLQY